MNFELEKGATRILLDIIKGEATKLVFLLRTESPLRIVKNVPSMKSIKLVLLVGFQEIRLGIGA